MVGREFLFRGKSRYDGAWVEGYYYRAKYYRHDKELCDFITVPYPNEENRPSDDFMVSPETIGQYTGHQDKNDKRIFEGDICRDGDCIVVVEWMQYGWYCRVLKGCVLALGMAFPLWQWDNCPENGNRQLEIIGNIHDNPELMEEKDG